MHLTGFNSTKVELNFIQKLIKNYALYTNVLNSCVFTDEIVAKVSSGTKPLRNHEVYVSTLSTDERLQVYNGILSQLKQNKQNLEDPFLYRDLDEKSQQTTSGIYYY